MDRKSPLDDIILWLENLAPGQREDVVYLASCTPGILINALSDTMSDDFLAAIRAHKGDAYKEIGLALSLKAVIEHFVINKRATAESWSTSTANLHLLSQKTNDETFANLASKKELLSRQWIKSCQQWHKMAEHSLSAQTLDEWQLFYANP